MTPTHPKYRGGIVREIGEHKFYLALNADEILHTRYMVAEVQELYIACGISQGWLTMMSQLMIDTALDAKDFKALREDMIAIGQNIKARIGFIASPEMYEELACVMFLMDDEPPELIEDWQIKKKEVWKNDRDFFLCAAFKRLHLSEHISTTDIIAVLQAAKERIAQLPNLTT